jgi:hypothetical protein
VLAGLRPARAAMSANVNRSSVQYCKANDLGKSRFTQELCFNCNISKAGIVPALI